jgi:molybdenum cofactor synthesis domain-containing protein
MPCTVELLSVGNELLLGNTINTNASWIATRITAVGGKVTRITTVADNLKEIGDAVKEILRRKPDFLITTGGIGPTFDDMTLTAVAKAMGTRLRLDARAVDMIKQHYSRRFPGKPIKLTAPRLKMARIPSSAVAVPNPVGTAPAVQLSTARTEIFCLPGVPREAKAIFKESILTQIQARTGARRFFEKWITVKGIMESTLAPAIDKTLQAYPAVYIKSHPRGFEQASPKIDVHFSTSARNPKQGKQRVESAASSFERQLKNLRRSR